MECCICFEEKEESKNLFGKFLKQYNYDPCKNNRKCFDNLCDDCLIKYVIKTCNCCEDTKPLVKTCMLCRSEFFKPLGIIYYIFDKLFEIKAIIDDGNGKINLENMYPMDYINNDKLLKQLDSKWNVFMIEFNKYIIQYRSVMEKNKIQNINYYMMKFTKLYIKILNFTQDTYKVEIEFQKNYKKFNEDIYMEDIQNIMC